MRINTLRYSLLALLLSSSLSLEFKGINFVSVPFTKAPYTGIRAKASLEHLQSTGANWISIPIVWFQKDIDSSEMHPIEEEVTTQSKACRSLSEKEIKAALLEANNLGLNVMLLPQVEILKHGWIRSSRIGIGMSPYQVRRWFKYYTEFLLDVAKYASAYKVKMLSIGHDLRFMAHYESFWNELIEEIRKVYSGKLVYSASSVDEYRQVGFFDKVDYIGLLADPKLKIDHRTELDQVKTQLKRFGEIIDYLKKMWKKEIIITRAARAPHAEKRRGKVKRIHHKPQEIFYHALHQEFQDKIAGIFYGDWSADPAHGGDNDGSISPQFKSGEVAIRKIFQGEDKLPEQPKEKSPKMYCEHCVEVDL